MKGFNKTMEPFFMLLAAASVFLGGCKSTPTIKASAEKSEAVAKMAEIEKLPEEKHDLISIDFQKKHYRELSDLADRIPFNIRPGSISFREFGGSKYFSIDMTGDNYDSAKTTTATRLSNEFLEKYKQTVSSVMSETFMNEVVAINVTLHCTHYNFTTDRYAFHTKEETLKLLTEKGIISLFLDGKIIAQDLIDRSITSVNGRRMKFKLTSI